MIGTPKAAARTTSRPAVETGLRRVSWVRIAVDDNGAARCEVRGVGHRLPSARRISLGTALALAAGGVPTVVRSPAGARPKLPAAG